MQSLFSDFCQRRFLPGILVKQLAVASYMSSPATRAKTQQAPTCNVHHISTNPHCRRASRSPNTATLPRRQLHHGPFEYSFDGTGLAFPKRPSRMNWNMEERARPGRIQSMSLIQSIRRTCCQGMHASSLPVNSCTRQLGPVRVAVYLPFSNNVKLSRCTRNDRPSIRQEIQMTCFHSFILSGSGRFRPCSISYAATCRLISHISQDSTKKSKSAEDVVRFVHFDI